MNNKDLLVAIRIAALAALLVFLLLAVAGCTNTPELTAAETTVITLACKDNAICIVDATDKAIASKVAQLEYEAEDKRIIKRNKLIVFLNVCDASPDHIIMEIVHLHTQLPNSLQKRRSKQKFGYAYTHDNVGRHARRTDFKCISGLNRIQW